MGSVEMPPILPDPAFCDQADWIGLSLIPGVGGVSFRRLLGAFGLPGKVNAAGFSALSAIVKPEVARRICEGTPLDKIQPTLEWLKQPQNHLVTLADEDYPPFLLETVDPPPLFYLKGRRELLASVFFAIVGSRNATQQGVINTRAFAASLSDNGFCIVSGMAAGIDASAHRGGLDGASSSIAIVGTGLDSVYPASNHALAHELAARGALISEFPLGTPAKPQNFPRRNRIISGLSVGCLVVEATLRSGSLITARLAAEQGREVFAIPGSIHSPLSKGCHALIKQGVKLVECTEDILTELKLPGSVSYLLSKAAADEAVRETVAGEPAKKSESPLLAALGFDPVDIDTLAARSGLTSHNVCAMLLRMELEGHVAMLPGGMYQRVSGG